MDKHAGSGTRRLKMDEVVNVERIVLIKPFNDCREILHVFNHKRTDVFPTNIFFHDGASLWGLGGT